jgi:hypothetical protein
LRQGRLIPWLSIQHRDSVLDYETHMYAKLRCRSLVAQISYCTVGRHGMYIERSTEIKRERELFPVARLRCTNVAASLEAVGRRRQRQPYAIEHDPQPPDCNSAHSTIIIIYQKRRVEQIVVNAPIHSLHVTHQATNRAERAASLLHTLQLQHNHHRSTEKATSSL